MIQPSLELYELFAHVAGKIQFRAVAGPPTLRDGLLAQPGRDAIPILVNGGQIADGADFQDLLKHPVPSRRFDEKRFAGVGDEKGMIVAVGKAAPGKSAL